MNPPLQFQYYTPNNKEIITTSAPLAKGDYVDYVGKYKGYSSYWVGTVERIEHFRPKSDRGMVNPLCARIVFEAKTDQG